VGGGGVAGGRGSAGGALLATASFLAEAQGRRGRRGGGWPGLGGWCRSWRLLSFLAEAQSRRGRRDGGWPGLGGRCRSWRQLFLLTQRRKDAKSVGGGGMASGRGSADCRRRPIPRPPLVSASLRLCVTNSLSPSGRRLGTRRRRPIPRPSLALCVFASLRDKFAAAEPAGDSAPAGEGPSRSPRSPSASLRLCVTNSLPTSRRRLGTRRRARHPAALARPLRLRGFARAIRSRRAAGDWAPAGEGPSRGPRSPSASLRLCVTKSLPPSRRRLGTRRRARHPAALARPFAASRLCESNMQPPKLPTEKEAFWRRRRLRLRLRRAGRSPG